MEKCNGGDLPIQVLAKVYSRIFILISFDSFDFGALMFFAFFFEFELSCDRVAFLCFQFVETQTMTTQAALIPSLLLI